MIKELFALLSLVSVCLSLQNGLGLTPQMGWNSWNYFRCNITESLIKETANSLVSSGLAAKGYVYVNLDDCWQISRDKHGRIQEDKDRFPSGIKALADYVHSLGLKFGIYSSAGFLTCERRPGSLGYEEIDAQTYAEWGVDYLKYDNCYNRGVPAKTRYTKMRDALQKSGRQIFYSICNWGEEQIETWGGEVGNSWRTTTDIENKWNSMIKILDQQVGLEVYAKPGAWNDPDMLEVGNGGLTESEAEAHFALWALLKAPLIIGCDITKLDEKTYKILSNPELIKLNQDPLGKQGKRISREEKPTGALEVWSATMINGNVLFILFNRSKKRESITADFRRIGYNRIGGYLKNIYSNENLGYHKYSYSSEVDAHAAVVVKIQRKNLK